MIRKMAALGLLSAAVLLLQVALTRFFSIAQFYHFAFLVVSLALLGFGGSGSLLAVAPRLRGYTTLYALGFALTTLLAFLFVNHYPFDAYRVALHRQQVILLIANLLALALPFGCAGLLIGAQLSQAEGKSGQLYGMTLLGSAVGAFAAPSAISLLGGERTILLAASLGSIVAIFLGGHLRWAAGLTLVMMGGLLVTFPPAFQIQFSPYKTLSRFELEPSARVLATRQNAYSRLDIVQSPTIHSAQGLSTTYFGNLPPQIGLILDGDNLLPVPQTSQAPPELAQSLPAAVAYALRPNAEVLILKSGGGMDVWAAVANGARQVTVIEPNALVFEALTHDLRDWFAPQGAITLRQTQIRSFVRRDQATYDVVHLALADNYHPISAGTFTLTEDYTLTVEAFRDYLRLCGEDGVFIINRWAQSPPSEALRTLAIILEALDQRDSLSHLFVFRSFQTVTFLVKPSPFTSEETDHLLRAVEDLHYDLVLAPRIPDELTNRYARLGSPADDQLFWELATSPSRQGFYTAYNFQVSPHTDDRPFFFHFFRWEQTSDILRLVGRRWQPFGGGGYLILWGLLVVVTGAGVVIILLPLALQPAMRRALAHPRQSARLMGYFAALGLAFLMVEVALIQQYILVLGEPTRAIAHVLGTVLLFSGLGSLTAHRFGWRWCLIGLTVLLLVSPYLLRPLTPALLNLDLLLRMVGVSALLAPPAYLMGMPFAKGIAALKETPDLIAWAWAVNGCASVISAVVGAIFSLSGGFTLVLMAGAGLYGVALLLSFPSASQFEHRSPGAQTAHP
jgi:spermidine synthase